MTFVLDLLFEDPHLDGRVEELGIARHVVANVAHDGAGEVARPDHADAVPHLPAAGHALKGGNTKSAVMKIQEVSLNTGNVKCTFHSNLLFFFLHQNTNLGRLSRILTIDPTTPVYYGGQ